MSTQVLEEYPPLTQLLDLAGFQEVCSTFSELYGIGFKVFDLAGHKIVDVRAATEHHCGYLFTVHATQVACTRLVSEVRTCPLQATDAPQTIECFSGLRYCVAPLVHQGSAVGRLIIGPFAPAGLSQPPVALKQHEPQLNLEKLAQYLAEIPRASDGALDKVTAHVQQVLGVIIHASFQTLTTSKLHIASMSSAFADLERSHRQLKEAHAKLQELDRLKSQFVAMVSHELRTPLTSVIGYSEMLLEGLAGDLADEQRGYVGTILEKGEGLLQLINQILDMSRWESGSVALQWEPVDMREVVQVCVSDVLPQAKKRGLALVTEINPEVTPIVADKDKLRRILTNLLGNAVKFTVRGHISVRVDVVSVSPDDVMHFNMFDVERNRQLRIQVVDSGVGIPPDKLEAVFEAFFQVPHPDIPGATGTGLGLAIVRSLVRAHGGKVTVDSREGAGTTFSVLLPYCVEGRPEGVSTEVVSGQRLA